MPHPKKYLGDAVYVEVDRFHTLVITTENGLKTTNMIYFDATTWHKLRAYVLECEEAGDF